MRGKSRKYVIADSALKRIQVDAWAFWLDADEHHPGFAPRTGGALKCNRWIGGRGGQVFNVGHIMGPTQTGPWRLLLLVAAHFCGIAGPNTIQRCREVPLGEGQSAISDRSGVAHLKSHATEGGFNYRKEIWFRAALASPCRAARFRFQEPAALWSPPTKPSPAASVDSAKGHLAKRQTGGALLRRRMRLGPPSASAWKVNQPQTKTMG
jgi:hypothetical protein